MQLNAANILKKLKRNGPRGATIYVASVLALGIVDQFTSRIVPSAAQLIQDFVDPPKFVINFKPPVETTGGLTVMRLPAAVPVKLKPIPGSRSIVAFERPGPYELRLLRKRNEVDQELVDTKSITTTDSIWLVDTSERNWVDAAELRASDDKYRSPLSDATPQGGARWSVTEQDYTIIGATKHPVLRSILANALVEVGTFENGNDREKRRIVSYWTAAGSHWIERISINNIRDYPWTSVFVAWVVKQAGLEPPDNSASSASWLKWGDEASVETATPGMIAIFRRGSGSFYIAGVVIRRQPSCLEVVAGNIADRVMITCLDVGSVVAIRRPQLVETE